MRILLLNWRDIRHPAGGGAEVWAHRVAEGLVERGHEVTFFAATVDGAPRDEVMNGVRVVRGGSRISVYRQARKFFLANRDSFDVILEEINTRPFFAHTWSDTPVVPMIHQVAREVWRYEAPLPVAIAGRYIFEPRWLRKFATRRVMTLSPSSADSLREYGLHDLVVVLPGSDRRVVTSGQKQSHPTVCFLGRLVKSKRPQDALRAFAHLKKFVPNAEFLMMGSGPLESKLREQKVPGAKILGRVSHEERERLLASSHVLVTTTVREGWGLNVSEAAELGTPTIGYDSPGLRDSIPLCGGQLVGQDPTSLGQALVDFFQGRLTIAPRIGTQSWGDVCRQIESELSNAVSRR